MGISRPIVSEIAYRIYAINEFGMATCFLLEGTERVLLIDTGCGMYNIREIADELSTLPYDVVLTHGHGDHVAWMDQWEEVWLHPADWDMVSLERLEQNKAMISRYPAMMAAFGSFDAYDIRPEQARYPDTLPRLIPLEEGHIFDLGGGRKVEVIHTPGHTPGEVVLIDDASRILFSGDACNPNLGIRASSVNTALKGLLKVKAQAHRFDRNFNGHIGYGASTVNISMPETNLDDDIQILRSILDGTAEVQYGEGPMGRTAFVLYNGLRLSFDPDRLIDPGETPAE